jgi:glucans biosynthesis protein C
MRLYFLDNIRLVLIVMVVLFHLALTYGARHGWYYYETTSDPMTSTVLTVFSDYGRAFVLGIFFMISGYFTPGACDRRGLGGFVADRVFRLAVPLVFFACIVRPTLVYTMNFDTLGSQYSALANIIEFRNVAPGPLWFVEVLLIFSGVYAISRLLWGRLAAQSNHEHGGVPGTASIVLFICILALSSYLVRIYYPPGRQVFHLRLGNYPQYVGMFIVGIMAFRRDWVQKLTDTTGRLWVAITLLTSVLYVAIILEGIKTGVPWLQTGGSGLRSLAEATFENLLCVGMLISLLFVFRRRWNFQGRLTGIMASDSYMVFIMHAPILVYFTYLLRPALQGNPMVKFCLASVTGVALCFFISHYVRKLPGVRKIV